MGIFSHNNMSSRPHVGGGWISRYCSIGYRDSALMKSLEEINSTIATPNSSASFWRKLWAFSGPGALVAVGYMDPGNWVTSMGGGAQYGYLLMSVILLSSVVAMILQYLSAKLGIVTGRDLAQATAEHTSPTVGFILWIIVELAIVATDIAEVIGSAIALNLLFRIPIWIGVIITVFDVLLLLLLMNIGFRKIEAVVFSLIVIITIIFIAEVSVSNPDLWAATENLMPQPEILHNGQLTMALGIVGATVMPHNLYLHSSIVQSRKIDRSNPENVRQAVRFAAWDSNIQLLIAFVVSSLLLILGAALFYGKGNDLSTFQDFYNALQSNAIVGSVASGTLATLFAVALLAAGQNSSITGTLSGQIVMEGFIHLRVPIWMRRMITRVITVIPVLACAIIYHGDEGALDTLLVNSQVFLCIALPFSIIPLVWFTSSKKIMGKSMASRPYMVAIGIIIALVLTVLNVWLIIQTVSGQ